MICSACLHEMPATWECWDGRVVCLACIRVACEEAARMVDEAESRSVVARLERYFGRRA